MVMTDSIYTPIQDCICKSLIDGTCCHPSNTTPECNQHICPVVRQAEKQLEQATTREEIKGILAGFSPEYLASCGIV